MKTVYRLRCDQCSASIPTRDATLTPSSILYPLPRLRCPAPSPARPLRSRRSACKASKTLMVVAMSFSGFCSGVERSAARVYGKLKL